MFDINFVMFMIASLVSRGMRFFLIAGLIWKFGAPVKVFIDKYFNMLATLFAAMLIGFTALTLWAFGSSETAESVDANTEAVENVELIENSKSE